MKLLILSNPDSAHTIKWVRGLAQKEIEILIFGFSQYESNAYSDLPNVEVHSSNIENSIFKKSDGSWQKLVYLKSLKHLKSCIKKFQPDILHAHYASSYGLLGALSGFHPFIISVWGSDIYDFPRKSFLHKLIVKYNFKKADRILSTSNCMAEQTRKYTQKNITVTPFGIDLNIFRPFETERYFSKNDIVIGTIKTLEKIYGISYLINAFKLLKTKEEHQNLKLLIVGGGTQEAELKLLTKELGIDNEVVFTGFVSYNEMPKYYNMLDIYVALSISESFGVAIIEASACEKPVVVSNVGGLPEVVEHGVTGFVVPKCDAQAAAEAINNLIINSNLRKDIGSAGRNRVKKFYNWQNNLEQMFEIYNFLLKK